MKKILFAAGLLIASVAHAESLSEPIDMSKLTLYEQTVHRLAWCREMSNAMILGKAPEFPHELSHNVFKLLKNRGYFDKDWGENMVALKTFNDLQAEILLGKTFAKEEAEACEADVKAILKEEYVPNFLYMEK